MADRCAMKGLHRANWLEVRQPYSPLSWLVLMYRFPKSVLLIAGPRSSWQRSRHCKDLPTGCITAKRVLQWRWQIAQQRCRLISCKQQSTPKACHLCQKSFCSSVVSFSFSQEVLCLTSNELISCTAYWLDLLTEGLLQICRLQYTFLCSYFLPSAQSSSIGISCWIVHQVITCPNIEDISCRQYISKAALALPSDIAEKPQVGLGCFEEYCHASCGKAIRVFQARP